MNRNEESSRDSLGALIAVLVGFVAGALAAWMYWTQRGESAESPPSEPGEAGRLTLELGPGDATWEPDAGAEVQPDDLTRVEGIGPKMSSVLQQAGIETFRHLARSDPQELKRLLRDERLQFADPSTWPEQAALAAAGAWEDLAALQEELSGGRRVG